MRPGFTYLARRVDGEGPIKIGSSVNPKERCRQLKYEAKGKCEVLATIPGREFERRLHIAFVEQRHWGEWFRWSPELQAVIDGLNDGSFDPETLPPIAVLPGFYSPGPERKRGAEIPLVGKKGKAISRRRAMRPNAYHIHRDGVTETRTPLRFLSLEQARDEANPFAVAC